MVVPTGETPSVRMSPARRVGGSSASGAVCAASTPGRACSGVAWAGAACSGVAWAAAGIAGHTPSSTASSKAPSFEKKGVLWVMGVSSLLRGLRAYLSGRAVQLAKPHSSGTKTICPLQRMGGRQTAGMAFHPAEPRYRLGSYHLSPANTIIWKKGSPFGHGFFSFHFHTNVHPGLCAVCRTIAPKAKSPFFYFFSLFYKRQKKTARPCATTGSGGLLYRILLHFVNLCGCRAGGR